MIRTLLALSFLFYFCSCSILRKSWSATDQRAFMGTCVPEASAANANIDAEDYCKCMLEKLMRMYSDPSDVPLDNESMTRLAKTCL